MIVCKFCAEGKPHAPAALELQLARLRTAYDAQCAELERVRNDVLVVCPECFNEEMVSPPATHWPCSADCQGTLDDGPTMVPAKDLIATLRQQRDAARAEAEGAREAWALLSLWTETLCNDLDTCIDLPPSVQGNKQAVRALLAKPAGEGE